MSRTKLIVMFLLSMLLFPINGLALEANYCEVYEQGNEEMLKENLTEYELKLEERVAYLNENFKNGNFVNYQYHLNKKVEYKKEVKETKVETVKVEEEFNTEEEALNYFENLTANKPFVFKNPVIDVVEKTNTILGDTLEKDCKTLDCKDEIKELQENLQENENLNYEIIHETKPSDEFIKKEYKEDNQIKYFYSKQEAEKFVFNYNPVLDGYQFIKNEVLEDKYFIDKEVTFNEIYENNYFSSRAEAEKALNQFKQNYPNIKEENITKVRDEHKDSILKDTIVFDTEEEKNAWILENRPKEEEGILEYSEKIITSNETVTVGPFEYNDINEANNKKEEYEQQGYVVEITTKTDSILTGNINSFKKIDKRQSEYIIPKDSDYFVIKQANSAIIWTKEKLNDKQKTEFLPMLKKYDKSIHVNSIEEAIWINGEDVFDLTSLGNTFGIYKVEINNENIIMTCDVDKISHLDYGTLSKIENNTYILTGVKTNEIKKYELSYVKTIYGFYYRVDASAIVKEEMSRYYVVSEFNKLIEFAKLKYSIDKIEKYNVYLLNYDKYEQEEIEKAIVNWEIIRCNYPNNYQKRYVYPPVTGFNIMNLFNFKNIMLVGLLVLLSLRIKKFF